MPRSRLLRAAANLALAVVALLLALVLLEGALAVLGVGDSSSDAWRTRGLQQPDSELIYSMRPSSRRAWTTEEFTEHASINSIGLRGPEISADAEGRFRILILGDSMTYGHGVDNVETFPARLYKLFAEHRPELDVEVINAGVRGYGTDHSYKLFMTRLRRLSPAIVILALNYNDLADNLHYPLYDLDGEELVALDATQSPLYQVATWSERLPAWLSEYRIPRLAVHSAVRLATRGYTDGRPGDTQRQKKKMLLQLGSMAEVARHDGFHLLVVGLPMRDRKWLPFTWLEEPLDGVAPLLDLSTDPSWRADKQRWFFPVNDHLSVAGNQRVAQILYDDLVARGWLEPADDVSSH